MIDTQIVRTRNGTMYTRRRQACQSREYLRSIAPPNHGELHYNTKLTDIKALAIFNAPGKHAVIAIEYGISESAVGKIKRKETWNHIHNLR